MAIRSREDDVRALVDNDSTINVVPFIEAANSIVDHVDTCDTDGDLNDDLLRQIETWLAAHFYAIRDPQYQEKKTGNASAVFQGQTGTGLDSTFWGQQAMVLDVSGCLSNINQQAKTGKRKVGLVWLGTEVVN